jgi:hypothetical protein
MPWSTQHDRGLSQEPIEVVSTSQLPRDHDPLDLKPDVLCERRDEEVDRQWYPVVFASMGTVPNHADGTASMLQKGELPLKSGSPPRSSTRRHPTGHL